MLLNTNFDLIQYSLNNCTEYRSGFTLDYGPFPVYWMYCINNLFQLNVKSASILFIAVFIIEFNLFKRWGVKQRCHVVAGRRANNYACQPEPSTVNQSPRGLCHCRHIQSGSTLNTRRVHPSGRPSLLSTAVLVRLGVLEARLPRLVADSTDWNCYFYL